MDFQEQVRVALRDLRTMGENEEFLLVKARRGPSKATKIPLILSPELACFIGMIVGDGHLRKDKSTINMEMTDLDLMQGFRELASVLFERSFNIHEVKPRANRKQSYVIYISNKSIHSLVNKVFNIQRGKKSNIVSIPKAICSASKEIKNSFLVGVMATDGGKRKKGRAGLTSASKDLRDAAAKLFGELGINVWTDEWMYKKYNKSYYGIVFNKKHAKYLERGCQSAQTHKILNIFLKNLDS